MAILSHSEFHSALLLCHLPFQNLSPQFGKLDLLIVSLPSLIIT
jgi:hypothetical protein